MKDVLRHGPSHYINGTFIEIPGESIVSRNPAQPDEIIWSGSPRIEHLELAIEAANASFDAWASLAFEARLEYLRKWQDVTQANAQELADLITLEMGKVRSESLFEANAMRSKVDIALQPESLQRVRDYQVKVSETRSGHCRFKPYGVMAIIGPFNFPAHLPNGQIVASLLSGNTIVFKPSEKTPAVGQFIAQMMDEVGLPRGVFNLVQGGGDLASKLVSHEGIHGVLFTGSWPVGRKILEANLDHPGRMIALELGGNNPAIVMDDAPLKLSVLECVRAAFATTGQRCTATRRIMIHEAVADRFISALGKASSTLLIGPGQSSDPVFMGPLVTNEARQAVLDHQARLVKAGGRLIVESSAMDGPGHFITPGIIEVDGFTLDTDCEIFGPLLQVSIVKSLDEAIEQANATNYGLAASIFTQSEASFETFFRRVNAGCINWNNGTAGASGKLPFGGRGVSGNNRPAAAFASDFCAYPVANMVEQAKELAIPGGVQWDNDWVS